MITNNSRATELRMAALSALRFLLNMTLDEIEKVEGNIEERVAEAHEAVDLLAQSARLNKQEREAARRPQPLEVRTVSLEEILSGLKVKIAARHGIPL